MGRRSLAQSSEQVQVPGASSQGTHDGLTPRHAAAGLRWLFDRYRRWGLNMSDLATLLGGLSTRRLYDWKRHVETKDEIEIPRDTLERISLLLGIHKALTLITPDGHEDEAYSMFQRPLDLFGLQGRSVRDFLLEDGSIGAMYFVRRSLDGMRA